MRYMYDGSIALDAASVTLEPSVPPLSRCVHCEYDAHRLTKC